MSYPLHPAVEIFPGMDQASFSNLVEDIRTNGQHEPILLWRGQVIDGRHRLRACEELGIAPKVREVDSALDDPIGLVLSLNLHRRHLSESQRAMVAARITTLRQGRRSDLQPSANLPEVTQGLAASNLNVSERLIRHARNVQTDGVPELVQAVDQGQLAVSTAATLTKLPEDTQRKVLARSPEELRAIAKDVKHRIKDSGVAGPSAVKVFDQVAKEQNLSGSEQVAVVEVIKQESESLPSPSEAKRLAQQGEPGLIVLGSDGRYHAAQTDPEEDARMQSWMLLRSGLEVLGTLPFEASQAISCIPDYQHENVNAWLDRAQTFVSQLGDLWRNHHA